MKPIEGNLIPTGQKKKRAGWRYAILMDLKDTLNIIAPSLKLIQQHLSITQRGDHVSKKFYLLDDKPMEWEE